jgi:hypothetical protein
MKQVSSQIRFVSRVASAFVAVALVPAALAAQTPDSRWLPWVGCWQPAGTAVSGDLTVCVTPQSSGSGIEVRTVANGQTVGTRTLVADGQRHPITEEQCTGWQTATFSQDGRRAYLRSQMTCDGQVRSASAIMALASPNEWIDAQAIGAGEDRAARVIRYTPASDDRVRAAGLEPPSSERLMAVADARLLAAVDLTLEDIAEAAPQVDTEALEAFIVERDQRFNVDAESLIELADAGVPEPVIDLVVAVSFPDRFALDREDRYADLRPADPRDRPDADRYDPFGWGGRGRYGYYGSCYGFGLNSGWYGNDPFFYSPYGYGRGCYDPFYYGRFGYGGYYGRPIIIVRGPEDDDGVLEPTGRVVNGRGYTRGGSSSSDTRRSGSSGSTTGSSRSGSTGRVAVPRATSGGYTRDTGSASSGGSSGSSTGRTAKPRTGGRGGN